MSVYRTIGPLVLQIELVEFNVYISTEVPVLNEPCCEKTGLQGFRPGPTQTGLYCNRRWLEA